MPKKRQAQFPCVQPYRYRSPNIPLSAIRRFARQIGECFHPDKIILFGSYAYGRPHEESDVDLLVVMPASNEISNRSRPLKLLLAHFPAACSLSLSWTVADRAVAPTVLTC